MCLFYALFLLLGPRAAIVFWWIVEPTRWSLTFSSAFIPLLGLLFLPWTTLFYVFVFPNGVEGLDWLLLALGLIVDIGSYGGSAYGNRDKDQYGGVGPYGT
jgi:hypothetical protein